jgi:hypothetical protein
MRSFLDNTVESYWTIFHNSILNYIPCCLHLHRSCSDIGTETNSSIILQEKLLISDKSQILIVMLKSCLSGYICCFLLLLLPSALGGYKEEHEGFVKNFKGTSAFFIIICLAHLPASILLLKIVQGSSKPLFIRDMFCLVLPLLLNMTVLADYCYITIFFMVTCEMIYIFRFNPYRARKPSDNDLLENSNLRVKSSFSSAVVRCQKAAYLNLFKGMFSPPCIILFLAFCIVLFLALYWITLYRIKLKSNIKSN